ncbi:MAG: hypothetical protein DRJ33_06700, partial [Candidatus Methanomethylicota archaeon]
LNIPLSYTFIGASGAIFGILYVASFIAPKGGVPTILFFLIVISMLQPIIVEFVLENPVGFAIVLPLILVFIAVASTFFKLVPSIVATFFFVAYTILQVHFGLNLGVSHFGHVGGMVGGLISLLVYSRLRSVGRWRRKAF